MRKFLVLLLMLFFANVAFAVNSYDRYGQKLVLIGKQLQATILMTDTVLKQALMKKLPLDIIPMISMDRKLVVTKQILMA